MALVCGAAAVQGICALTTKQKTEAVALTMPYGNEHWGWEQEPQTFPGLLPAVMLQKQPQLPAGMGPGPAVPLAPAGHCSGSCWRGRASCPAHPGRVWLWSAEKGKRALLVLQERERQVRAGLCFTALLPAERAANEARWGPGTAQIPLWLSQRVITALILGTGLSAVRGGSNSRLSLLLILLCVAVLFKHPHQLRT